MSTCLVYLRRQIVGNNIGFALLSRKFQFLRLNQLNTAKKVAPIVLRKGAGTILEFRIRSLKDVHFPNLVMDTQVTLGRAHYFLFKTALHDFLSFFGFLLFLS